MHSECLAAGGEGDDREAVNQGSQYFNQGTWQLLEEFGLERLQHTAPWEERIDQDGRAVPVHPAWYEAWAKLNPTHASQLAACPVRPRAQLQLELMVAPDRPEDDEIEEEIPPSPPTVH